MALANPWKFCPMCFRYESLDKLVAIGCDGTNVNTGRTGGVIRLLEDELQRPLQWLICQLHFNELPLRHLLLHLDGVTSGPRSFSGPIGKQMSTCEKSPIVAFSPIDVNLPDMTDVTLSTDQQYLYKMCKAVGSGSCSTDIARREPGTLSHARWLTAANRLLRLYVSTKTPHDNLVTLVTYILKVYAPMWFSIKAQSSCTSGARHLWEAVHKSRYLCDALKAVIDPVIKRNAFFGHSENILL
jgi:hypothetical protein